MLGTEHLLAGKDKKRVNASLPAGVTDRDLTYFTQCQEKAKKFLTGENAGIEEEPSLATPKAPHHTPLPKNTPQVNSPDQSEESFIVILMQVGGSPGGVNVRTPKMIQFGRYHITTWYSSPYPQVTDNISNERLPNPRLSCRSTPSCPSSSSASSA